MLNHFRSYQLAAKFYRRAAQQTALPYAVKDQFHRAALSIALNLAEGSSKPTRADRRRFYRIALGSTRECEAIIQLVGLDQLSEDLDCLARHICRLCKALE